MPFLVSSERGIDFAIAEQVTQQLMHTRPAEDCRIIWISPAEKSMARREDTAIYVAFIFLGVGSSHT